MDPCSGSACSTCAATCASLGRAITEEEIEAELIRRKEARVAKDFTTSDAIRESLGKKGSR